MKSRASVLICIALGLGSAAAFADDAAPTPVRTSTVRVAVGPFRNYAGALGCRLYRAPKGFPEASEGAVEMRVPIAGDTARCDFPNLPPGAYAVSVLHDENSNGKLDKNLFGIPTEGYGVSNNHTHAMSAPSWDESKFTVEAGKDVGLGIALRY